VTVAPEPDAAPHQVSVVVPVYQGERSLAALVEEIRPWTKEFRTPGGRPARIAEVLFVYDHGPDRSDRVIRQLAADVDFVHPVWLSRNFGQHAGTLAGMASSGGDWIVTMDEDGQHDPAAIGAMLDVALDQQATLVYAKPTNPPPHGIARNTASRGSKWVTRKMLGGGQASSYHSFRLVLGEIGRSVAAYAGSGVYLDVALEWVSGDIAVCPVAMRTEADRHSGYSLRSLASHFWRMVLTSGTRGLRMVSVLGGVLGLSGVIVALWLVINRLLSDETPQGWTSTIVVVLLSGGAILVSLGIVAEYIGVAVNMAMGKPLYLIVGDPQKGPLGRNGRRP
jgi:glycosyltransferase involved in cell wall biosynthesis